MEAKVVGEKLKMGFVLNMDVPLQEIIYKSS
jgi:hypothetical protein